MGTELGPDQRHRPDGRRRPFRTDVERHQFGLLGRPVGIFLASALSVRLGLGRITHDTPWPMVLGLGAKRMAG